MIITILGATMYAPSHREGSDFEGGATVFYSFQDKPIDTKETVGYLVMRAFVGADNLGELGGPLPGVYEADTTVAMGKSGDAKVKLERIGKRVGPIAKSA